MYFYHSHLPTLFFSIPSEPPFHHFSLPNSNREFLKIYNPLNPVHAVHMHMDIGPSIGAGETYQGLPVS